MNHERVVSLWVKIKGLSNIDDITVGTYYRLPNQKDKVNEEYRNAVSACGGATRKAKTLILVKEVKDSKKGFFKFVSSKRKTRENGDILLNEVSVLLTKDSEKSEFLSTFFASAFFY